MSLPVGRVLQVKRVGIAEVLLAIRRESKFDYSELVSFLLILLLPFLLLRINNSWIFPSSGFIDRWVYSGLHLHLPEFLNVFGATYYASRVPWTIPGWFLHLILDDERALYVLHFSFFYVASFSLYYAVRNIFGNRGAALAAALAMGTNTYFLAAIGWDYVDGCSIAFLLASFAALSSAAVGRHWRLAAFAWGATICLAVSTYVLLVLFVPIEIGTLLLLNRSAAKHPLVAVGTWAASGGLVTTLGLGLMNWLLGGPFLYLMGQINPLAAVAGNRPRWYLPLMQWVWDSPWLLLPAIAFAFSCLFAWLHRKSVLQRLRSADSALDWEISLFACCLADVAASLIFVALQADHFSLFHLRYRANSLLPFTFLVMGGAFAALCKPLPRIREMGFLIIVVASGLAPWLLTMFPIPRFGLVFPRGALFQTIPILVIGWIVGGALLMAFVVQRPYGSGVPILIAFFSIIGVGAPAGRRPGPESVPGGYLSFPPDPASKQETLAVFDASRAIARYNADARARFWFDADDPRAGDLRDIASTYLYEYRLVNEAFPKLTAKDGKRASINPGDRIVLLTSKGNPISLANDAVAGQNIVFDELAEIPIRRPGVAFTAFITDVKIDPSKYEEMESSEAVFGQPAVPGLSSQSPNRFPTVVSTPAQPWAYGARFPLQRHDLKGPLLIRIKASVRRGPVGIGVLNRDGSNFLSRIPLFGVGDNTVILSVPELQQIGDLVIESWEAGKRGEVTVDGITVLKPRSPLAESR